MLGAILLTGLLGGAIATHLRVGSPIFTHMLFGLYLGLAAWGGLLLRDNRLRAMILPWDARRRNGRPETAFAPEWEFRGGDAAN